MSKVPARFLGLIALLICILLIPLVTLAAVDVAPDRVKPRGGYDLVVEPRGDDIAIEWNRHYPDFIRPLFWSYRIEQLYGPPNRIADGGLTADQCLNHPGWATATHADGSPLEGNDITQIGGRVKWRNRGGLDANKGISQPAFFRVVATSYRWPYPPFPPPPVVLTCSTKLIFPQTATTDTIRLTLTSKDKATGTDVAAEVKIDGHLPTVLPPTLSRTAAAKDTTPLTLPNIVKDGKEHTITFVANGYKPLTQKLTFDQSHPFVAELSATTSSDPSTGRDDPTADTPGSGGEAGGASGDEVDCYQQYLQPQKLITGGFSFGKFVACQIGGLGRTIANNVTRLFGAAPIFNTWDWIEDREGIKTVWKVTLGFVDFIVVGGLLVAAFANIFRFKIDAYALKAILPGLIIGIILANLSFFTVRLMVESASIISQVIGNIVDPYINLNMGRSSSAEFLPLAAWQELSKSLFTIPGPWITTTGLKTNPAESGITVETAIEGVKFLAYPIFDFASTSVIILISILVLLFSMVPLILFAILLFLLYIRHFVLILLFMLAPLAFFCLGFPPLRGLWQRWWGTFWKWLLMMPVSFLVVGLAVIFLDAMNEGIGTGGRTWDPLMYMFVNGIAVGLLFLAIRVPFMLGPALFGIGALNVMDRWAGAGSKTAQWTGKQTGKQSYYLGNKGWEKGADWLARKRAVGSAPPLAYPAVGTPGRREKLRQIGEDARRLKLKRETGETWDDFIHRLNIARNEEARKAAEKKLGDRYKTFNPIRSVPAYFAGREAKQKTYDSNEARAVRSTRVFGASAGREAAGKYVIEDNRERYNNYESLPQITTEIGEIVKGRDGYDYLMEKIGQKGPGAFLNDKELIEKGYTYEELGNLSHLLRRFRAVGRQKNATTRDVLAIAQKSMNRKYGILDWKAGTPGQPFDVDQFREDRQSEGGRGATTSPYIDSDNNLSRAMNELTKTAKQQGVATGQLLRTLQYRMDSGEGSIGPRALGLTSEQWRVMKIPLANYIKEHGSRRMAFDRGLSEESGIAENIAKYLAKNAPGRIGEFKTKIDGVINDLKVKPTLDTTAIRQTLQEMHPSIQVAADSSNPQAMRNEFLREAYRRKEALGAIEQPHVLEAIQKGQGRDIDIAVNQSFRAREAMAQAHTRAAEMVENLGTTEPRDLQSNPAVIQHITPAMKQVVDFHPELQKTLTTFELPQQEAIMNKAAEMFAGKVAERAKAIGDDVTVVSHINDPDQPEFRQQLDEDLMQVFTQSVQAMQRGEIQPQAPAAEVTPTAEAQVPVADQEFGNQEAGIAPAPEEEAAVPPAETPSEPAQSPPAEQ